MSTNNNFNHFNVSSAVSIKDKVSLITGVSNGIGNFIVRMIMLKCLLMIPMVTKAIHAILKLEKI